MLLLACLLPAHLLAQDDLALTPASLDRSSPSGPTSGLLLNAQVQQPERNGTEEVVCPVCGTNGTETAKNCCAPGGTWHGTCAVGEQEAEHTIQAGLQALEHTIQEGLQACRCENNVVCRLRRDLDRAVTQLDAAKKHQTEAMARKDREVRLNRLAMPRNNSNVELQEVLPPPEQKLYIGRFGSGTTDQWCQKNCMEIAGLCPNERCAENTHGQQADVVASRNRLDPRMSAPEPKPEPAADARARKRASSAQKRFEDVPNTARGSVPAGIVGAINQPPNQPVENTVGSPSRKLREREAARSAQQPPAPSAQRPAPSAQRPAASAQQPAPSAQRPPSGKSAAAREEEMCPGHPKVLRSSPTCTAASTSEAKAVEMCPGHPNVRRSSPTCQDLHRQAREAAARGAAAREAAAREAAAPGAVAPEAVAPKAVAPNAAAPNAAAPEAAAPEADTSLRRASMTDELKPVGMSHCAASDTGPIKVAS